MVRKLLAGVASCCLLSACGGGGVNSTTAPVSSPATPSPTPTPSPSPTPSPTPTPTATPTPTPTPTSVPNSSVTDLHSNEQFAVRSVVDEVRFNIDGRYSYEGKNGNQALTISYDAAAGRYTVTTSERSRSFVASDIANARIPGTNYYVKVDGPERDVLMLATQPRSGTVPNKYVGYGYWQHDLIENNIQNAHFNFFTYGFPSPATAIPRSGSAGWAIDLYGVATDSGFAPYILSGPGTFNIDFDTANFSAHVNVKLQDATTDEDKGTTNFWALGYVSGDGSFTGNATVYGGSAEFAGPIEGRLYGPNGEELGATVTGTAYRGYGTDAVSGKIFVGAITGQRDPLATPVAMTLSNLVGDISSSSQVAEITTSPALAPVMGKSTFYYYGAEEEITLKANGDIRLTSPVYFGFEATFTQADRIGQTTIFDSYRKTVANKVTTLEMFRPGPVNSEINLTYASFGSWSTAHKDDDGRDVFRSSYFVYGVDTRAALIMNRTGNGHYDGVVHGTGTLKDALTFRVGGTSFFDIDFTNATYSGALDLQKLAADGSVATSLGRWTFSDRVMQGSLNGAGLTPPAAFTSVGEIQPRFFGPNGEEIGALFQVRSTWMEDPNPIWISGATVAKQK